MRTRHYTKLVHSVLLLFLLFVMAPVALFADHMATCITVFDVTTFQTMVGAKALRQVPDGVLFGKSLIPVHYFGGQHKTSDAFIVVIRSGNYLLQ